MLRTTACLPSLPYLKGRCENVTPGGTVSIDSLLARARILQETAIGKLHLKCVDTSWYILINDNLRSLFGRTWDFAFHAALPPCIISFQTRWSVRSKVVARKPDEHLDIRPNQEAQAILAMCKSCHHFTSLHLVAFAEWVLGNMARALRYIQPTCLHSLFFEELLQLCSN